MVKLEVNTLLLDRAKALVRSGLSSYDLARAAELLNALVGEVERIERQINAERFEKAGR